MKMEWIRDMVKLKSLSMHKLENVPDHIVQEITDFSVKLALAIKPHMENVPANIALGGLNWVIPVFIKHLVADDPEELRKAARMSCQMLSGNMEILIDKMEKENSCGNS